MVVLAGGGAPVSKNTGRVDRTLFLQRWQYRLNFEISDSLAKRERLGLAGRDGNSMVFDETRMDSVWNCTATPHSIPMTDVVRPMQWKWAQKVHFNSTGSTGWQGDIRTV